MGQTPSSRMLQQATELQSDTADRKAADLTRHAMAKQQWKLNLEAKRRALGVELRTLIEEGLPEHRNTVEEFRLVSRQLEAAKAEQKDALLIAELEDELQAVYTKLVIAAEGLPGYEDLMSAIEGCKQQLEADMPGSRRRSGELHCTHQKGEAYEGHLPLRHRPRPLKASGELPQVQTIRSF